MLHLQFTVGVVCSRSLLIVVNLFELIALIAGSQVISLLSLSSFVYFNVIISLLFSPFFLFFFAFSSSSFLFKSRFIYSFIFLLASRIPRNRIISIIIVIIIIIIIIMVQYFLLRMELSTSACSLPHSIYFLSFTCHVNDNISFHLFCSLLSCLCVFSCMYIYFHLTLSCDVAKYLKKRIAIVVLHFLTSTLIQDIRFRY